MPDFMYSSRNRIIAAVVALLAVVVGAVVLFTGGSGGGESAATTTTEAATASTLPVGETIPVGVIKSITVTDLSEGCATALTDMRAIMSEFKSGLLISAPADVERLNAAMATFRAGCSADEQTRVNNEELAGWYNAATGVSVGAPGSDAPAATVAG